MEKMELAGLLGGGIATDLQFLKTVFVKPSKTRYAHIYSVAGLGRPYSSACWAKVAKGKVPTQ